jgi:hypothetical protein
MVAELGESDRYFLPANAAIEVGGVGHGDMPDLQTQTD